VFDQKLRDQPGCYSVPRSSSGSRSAARGRWAPPGARNPIRVWEPSQKGLIADRPHRQNATVRRPAGIGRPSWAVTAKSPRTISGPSSYTVTTAPACPVTLPSALRSVIAACYPKVGGLSFGRS